jgi:hypothetical protein
MMTDAFVDEIIEVSKEFFWIKRTEIKYVQLTRTNLRLWVNNSFIDVFFNSSTGRTSYAFVHEGKRIFGMNNAKIGWHLHPYGDYEKHEPIKTMSIREFLITLENELRKRGKL